MDASQTWAVRPQTMLSQTDVPSMPDELNGRPKQAASPSISLNRDFTSGDSEEDFDTFRAGRPKAPEGGAYKPSFSKATFQWMRGELLGKGSYGRVYLAMNATTGDLLAVKQVELPKTASDKINSQQLDVMKALRFESDTLRDLDHPNIVQYLGFEESQDYLSIFLEYVPGGTISALLRQHGRLREEVTTSFLHQILKGLEYLHLNNILHRDLKADNILVQTSGVCKISDFGISKKASDLHQGGRAYTMMKGTVYWMAPEVLTSEGQGYDAKVDIWSVGCVAVEMWTGVRPWSEFSMMPVMMKLVKEKLAPPLPSDIQLSSLAEAFRQACFHADPRKRPHARLLKKHPYLHSPINDWVFDITNVADTGHKPAQASTSSPPYPPAPYPDKMWNGRCPTDDENTTARPPNSESKSSHKPSLRPLQIPEYKPSKARPDLAATYKPSRERPRKVSLSRSQADGPPLVEIKPLNPPKSYPVDENSGLASSTSERSQSRKGRLRRLLIVANPDDDTEDSPLQSTDMRKPTFKYTPPPLPGPETLSSAMSPNSRSSRLPDVSTPATSGLTASASSPPHTSSLSSASAEPSPSPALPTSRSPRPLPGIPPSSAPVSRYPSSHIYQSGYRPQPAVPSQAHPSSSSAFRAAHPQQQFSTSVNGKSIRKLPISPPRLKTSNSVAHLPSASSRSIMKQKSVPDVSIFAFDPATRRSGQNSTSAHRSFSMDADLEEEFDALMSHNHSGNAFSESLASASARGNGGKRQESLLALRPKAEDVYEHLESWFPHHDLDQPVDGGTTPTDARTADAEHLRRQRKADGRKSIRMIAKEQSNRSHVDPAGSRRRTGLWNSYVQELKT